MAPRSKAGGPRKLRPYPIYLATSKLLYLCQFGERAIQAVLHVGDNAAHRPQCAFAHFINQAHHDLLRKHELLGEQEKITATHFVHPARAPNAHGHMAVKTPIHRRRGHIIYRRELERTPIDAPDGVKLMGAEAPAS